MYIIFIRYIIAGAITFSIFIFSKCRSMVFRQYSPVSNPGYALVYTHVYKIPGYARSV
jgi:hypothetical protein